MKRGEVEALLADAIDGGVQKLRSHQVEALCRRWLAVEDAPVVADPRYDHGALLNAASKAGYYVGRPVRIVPEQGEGERG